MRITLKDGSCKEYGQAMSIYDIALDISEGLARMACAGQVDGQVEDLRTVKVSLLPPPCLLITIPSNT